MLSSLHIENIAVIKNIDIEFSCSFNVLTGETGAGKSIVIDSINLLRGSRVDRELVRSGESSAFVGALFSDLSEEVLSSLADIDVFPDENGEIYIQRTIFADGKSNAKINGRSISASLLKSITPFLLAIHGQNENQMLANDDSNIALLDKYSGLDAELGEYRRIFQSYVEVSNEIKELTRDESERIRTLEMLNYQIADIEAAKLKPSEEEKLLDKKVKIKNIERITKQLNFAYKALKGSEKSNACYILDRTISALESISDVVYEASRIKDMLSEAYSVIEDAAELVYDMTDDECGDPEKALDEIESRLDVIHKLKKKYGPDVESIIRYKDDAIRKKEALDSADDRIAQLENRKKSILKDLDSRALDLHNKRMTASSEMSEKVCKNLVFLDMPKVKFEIFVVKILLMLYQIQ